MALVHGEDEDRWYFTKEELKKTPSVLSGIDIAKELSYRQQSANLIQDMGQRLSVSQLTINTAIVYMHRFYMFHSFTEVNRNVIAPCCLFLSAKLEEQPRKLEHVIKVAHACLHSKEEQLDTKSEKYLQQAQDLVINESILLQTLGFELTVDHPHTHVVRITQLVRASKDLAQTSYFMATNSLHLTSFCIQHKPSVVACVCIHLACKWSNWEFPRSSDNKDWWEYVDPTVTKKSLDTICQEFLNIIENCPNKLKKRINTVTIYKGGHRPKTSGESSSKSLSAPNNGTAKTSKGEPSSSSSSTTKSHVENNVEKPNKHGSETNTSDATVTITSSAATLTITSSAAVVETPTSKVVLPPLPPLTTKYANISSSTTSTVSRPEGHRPKISSGTKDDGKMVLGGKHKLREHDGTSSPAKKLKVIHSSSSHGSHSKHGHSVPGRPPSQPKHSSHQSSRPGSHHSTPKVPSKSSAHGQPHHGHHSSVKRHNHPPHSSNSTHSGSSHSANKLPSLHKHRTGSPLDAKKSSGDRHRRPSSSLSVKPKSEAPPSTSLQSSSTSLSQTRTNNSEQTKRDVTTAPKHSDGFVSPPGPQRFPGNMTSRLPPLPPSNSAGSKQSSHHQPPLPPDGQTAPPPPPPLPPPPPT